MWKAARKKLLAADCIEQQNNYIKLRTKQLKAEIPKLEIEE